MKYRLTSLMRHAISTSTFEDAKDVFPYLKDCGFVNITLVEIVDNGIVIQALDTLYGRTIRFAVIKEED